MAEPKHSCNQTERILTLELNHKQMAIDVTEIKKDVKEINTKFDDLLEKLESKFVLRKEFNTAITVIWAIGVVVGIIMYFKK